MRKETAGNKTFTRRTWLQLGAISTIGLAGCVADNGSDDTNTEDNTTADAANDNADEIIPDPDCPAETREPVEAAGDPVSVTITSFDEDSNLERLCQSKASETAIETLGERLQLDSDLHDAGWIGSSWRESHILLDARIAEFGRVERCPEISFEEARAHLPRKVTVTLDGDADSFECTHEFTVEQLILVDE